MRGGTCLLMALLIAGATAMTGQAREFVVNGCFEEELSIGWNESMTLPGAVVERRTDLDPDEDYELHIQLTGSEGITRLFQRWEIACTGMQFSAKLRCSTDGTGGAWTAAGVVLRYLDCQMAELGESAIVSKSRDCPWADSPTFHLIEISKIDWGVYAFDLDDELLNLPGIDPEQIAFLDVMLMYEADNC